MFIRYVIKSLGDLLWPPRCCACDALLTEPASSSHDLFCGECVESLIFNASPKCPRCALPYEGVGPDHLCAECLKTPPPFERAEAVYEYGGAAADVVLRLKYGGMTLPARPMGRLMADRGRDYGGVDLIVPVPLFPKRLRKRGFNQSALLAREMGRRLRVPVNTSALRRIRDTVPQAGLSREHRLENIRGAFSLRKPASVSGRRILLVDDVVTTGTTVREAARVLTKGGAVSVTVVAFARAS